MNYEPDLYKCFIKRDQVDVYCILSKRKNNKLIYEIICLVPHDYCQSVYNGRPNQSYYIGQQQVLSADICSQVPPLQRAESCQS